MFCGIHRDHGQFGQSALYEATLMGWYMELELYWELCVWFDLPIHLVGLTQLLESRPPLVAALWHWESLESACFGPLVAGDWTLWYELRVH